MEKHDTTTRGIAQKDVELLQPGCPTHMRCMWMISIRAWRTICIPASMSRGRELFVRAIVTPERMIEMSDEIVTTAIFQRSLSKAVHGSKGLLPKK